MSEHRCFLIEETAVARIELRRFTYTDRRKCPGRPQTGHDAAITIGEQPVLRSERGYIPELPWARDDERWPGQCAYCTYLFGEEDEWQCNQHLLYRPVPDDGRRFSLREAPVGAMWDCWWLRDYADRYGGPDGRILCVRTPGGEWIIDGPPSYGGGGKWQRTGEVPCITVSPSILIGGCEGSPVRYHGWLQNGVLVSTSDSPT